MSNRSYGRRVGLLSLAMTSALPACAAEPPEQYSDAQDDDEDDGESSSPSEPGDAGRPDARGNSQSDGRAQANADASPSAERPQADPGDDDGTTCAEAELTTARVVPKVWLMIDGSGSMAAPLTGLVGPSRWQVLRDALLGSNDSLVRRLQSAVEFGLMVYDGGLSPPGVYIPGVCPRELIVEPALDNFDSINASYPPLDTGASTPTHYALLSLSERIRAARDSGDDTPMYVVLATDGMPNLCDFHDGIPSSALTEQQAIDTVAELAAAGTKTFAISLAGDDAQLKAHLDAVASAGATGKSSFTTTSQGSLVEALTEILGGTTSCTIRVEGKIEQGYECDGEVTLDGAPLECDAADGYRVLDDHESIELLGSACDTLQKLPSASVSARFPCDAVIFL